jgi:hypothetical protein
MNHLMPIAPTHVRLATGAPLTDVPLAGDNLDYLFGIGLPHYLRRRQDQAELIFPSDLVLETGDTLTNEYGGEVVVTEILERRKARGDWSKNPFDQHPDWVKVKILWCFTRNAYAI